jgi:prolyl-tRNA editing enzyme YbaK/EbsC (Cys-tRNA(Pro) deacylase)
MPALLPIVQQALDTYGLQYSVLNCDPDFADTAAFCEQYGFTLSQSANTIIVAAKGDTITYAACVVLATTKLDVNKRVRKLLNAKKASFANGEQTVQLTNMMIGGVTIFGLPDTVPIYVDSAVIEQHQVVMGGGNRSAKVVLDPQQLKDMPRFEIVTDLAIPKA